MRRDQARVCLLGDARSVHLARWARGLSQLGYQVFVLSFAPERIQGVGVRSFGRGVLSVRGGGANWRFLMGIPAAIKIIGENNPTILHAHYATSYGLLGAVAARDRYVVSVWGSDVLEFPKRSWFHRWLLRRNLARADVVCCTSRMLGTEARRYSRGPVVVTPFGVDGDVFCPGGVTNPRAFVVGSVKRLDAAAGIDVLMKAFAIVTRRYEGAARLILVGDGAERARLERLAQRLRILRLVEFVGQVPHEKVVTYLRRCSVAVWASRVEGFGVSVLEAQACGVPVIVSDVGGLPEVVDDGRTGFVVRGLTVESLADRLLQLAYDEDLRRRCGAAAREFVRAQYSWESSLQVMDRVYEGLLR